MINLVIEYRRNVVGIFSAWREKFGDAAPGPGSASGVCVWARGSSLAYPNPSPVGAGGLRGRSPAIAPDGARAVRACYTRSRRECAGARTHSRTYFATSECVASSPKRGRTRKVKKPICHPQNPSRFVIRRILTKMWILINC